MTYGRMSTTSATHTTGAFIQSTNANTHNSKEEHQLVLWSFTRCYNNGQTSTLSFNTLSSFKGEVFVPSTVAPRQVQTRNCLPRYGVDYVGDLDVTLGGHTCLQWSSSKAVALSHNKEFIPEVTLKGNKCRNPDKDPEGPWCYVDISGNVTVDYCDVELCGK